MPNESTAIIKLAFERSIAESNPDLPTRSGPAKLDDFVFWHPCIGLPPIVVEEPRAFLMGQAIVIAISLGALGLLVFLLPSN